MTDRELLAIYVERDDQSAFGELVRRHVDWVHSMARRLTRDETLAADVTQGVFALLARKAGRLRREVTLSGWLFLVTRYGAMRLMRDETRRRGHERKAASMRSVIQEPVDSVEWDELAPMLDELVGRLRDIDRRAVILRFYERKTFGEIGQALSISEEAARKRVERSVERLRAGFGRRGVTVGSAALMTAMTTHLTQPACAAVVAGATAAGAGAGAGLAKVIGSAMRFAWLKPVAAALGLILLAAAGTTLILQQPSEPAQESTAPQPAAEQPERFRYGRVINFDDRPVAGATVRQIEWQMDQTSKVVATAVTDADGRFRVPRVGDLSNILIQSQPHAFGGKIIYSPSEDDPTEIVLLPATTLKVRFLDPDGKPAAGLRVALAGCGESRNGWRVPMPSPIDEAIVQTADAEGFCHFPNLPQGGIAWVHVLDDRYAQIPFSPWFELSDAPASDGGTLRLKAAASISGRVVYADTGLPAAKVHVMATGDASGAQANAFTDEQGRYALKQLQPDNYCVFLFLSDVLSRQVAAAALENRRVFPGVHLEDQDLKLIKGAAIRGKITNRDTGKPVVNAGVFVDGPSRPNHTSTIQIATTDAAGEYIIHVPPGPQHVQIALPLPAGYAHPQPLDYDLMLADGQTQQIDFALPTAPGMVVKGRAVDPQGQPLANVEVYVEDLDRRFSPGYVLATSNASGGFTIPNVSPGSKLRGRKGRWSTLAPVEAVENATLTLHPDALGSIRVTVTQPDGTAIPNAKVELRTDISYYIGQKPIGTDGIGIFRSLAPDVGYHIVARAKGFGKAQVQTRVEPGKQVQAPAIVLPWAQSRLVGKVIQPDGQPVMDAHLTVYGEMTDSQTVTTNVYGQFEAENLVTGDRIRVIMNETASYQRASATVTAGGDNVLIIAEPK